ncbi:8-amino-7-oxononanoate synthase [Shewanella sp. KX20019]|uniref:8-amino-7-oxononanoate synthase n=1 Tax=Shewanella sp. KX20019 TaxID=2803864 RepID=UPI001927ECB1|nr:8-amino-7-oxononanoate synthase [Shewanella sp. KX20019]QQX82084.1 8-amino-7-oxononanoate synthase [Shewanella sp. KX20019]
MSDAAAQKTTPSLLQSRVIDTNRALEEQGLLRKRIKVMLDAEHANCFEVDDLPYINFSSNDYLGLSRSTKVIEALHEGAKSYGFGSASSPLVVGYSQAHQQLEQTLCQATGHEAALLFCSGFSANNALMKCLFNHTDTVLADKLVHASVIDGLQDSGAVLKRFIHNDLVSANTQFERHSPCALLTESVFSMDGDIAPLVELSALCKQHNAWLIVDDAHGFGVVGEKGLGATALANDIHIDAQIVTFGKALGGQGAAILGSQELIDYLVANARHYIYSTALSPANAVAVNAAVAAIIEQPSLNEQLQHNIHCFIAACQTENIVLTGSTTAIQPIIIGESARTLAIAKRLKEHGFWVGAIRPPTVAQGSARLRITLTAEHREEDIHTFVAVLADILQDD